MNQAEFVGAKREKKYLRPAIVRSLARLGPPKPQARKNYGPSTLLGHIWNI